MKPPFSLTNVMLNDMVAVIAHFIAQMGDKVGDNLSLFTTAICL